MRTPSEPRSSSPEPDGALRRVVAELAFPRFAGTAGERRAADLVAARFAAAGLEVAREDFRASRTALPRFRHVVQGGLAGGTALFAGLLVAGASVAWLAGAATIAWALVAGKWRRSIEPAFDTGTLVASANVVGRRASRATPAPPRLVFLAHLDTKSTRVPTFWTAAISIAALGWLAAATIASAVMESRQAAVPFAVPLVGLLLASALLVATNNPMGDESPGAMDNASGLAVLLELAGTLPNDPSLERVDLTFLATGAEELGLCGAMRWIQAHEAELDRARTVFVNVDSVGVGRRLLAVDVHGRAPDGRPMQGVVTDVARSERVPLGRVPFLPGVGVDTMPIGARGFATVSILGEVLGAAARRIHSRRDTLDHVSEEGLRTAVRFLEGLAREIARCGSEGGGEAPGPA